jgi:hypothetical protein
LNLIGGNRLVLFIGWNPAVVDKQAAAFAAEMDRRNAALYLLGHGDCGREDLSKTASKGLQSVVDDKEQVNT